ncbi:beta-lactamase domain protein, partial [mine drainage metagenome]
THGHLDHCGAMAFLDPSIPVVASPTTVALLRAWQESGKSDLTSEVTYLAPRREVADSGGRLIETDRSAAKPGREFRTIGDAPTALVGLLDRSPYSGDRTRFEPGKVAPAPRRLGDGLRVDAYPVDHSVYGAMAFVLEADGGPVAYSGDLRFHGEKGPQTEAFVRALESRPPELLIVEGTRLTARDDVPHPAQISEDDVQRNCRARVEEYPDRLVVADFGPRNVERLRRFRRIALATGRQLVVTPKDAFLLHLLHASDPSIEVDLGPGGMRILREPTTRTL